MASKSARSRFTKPFNPGRRRFIKILGSGSVVLLLYGCGLTPQSQTPTAALDEGQTSATAVETEQISTIETDLQQNPLYLMDNELFRVLVQAEDPIALDIAAKMEELIHQNPDWQDKAMADFDMSVIMLSGEGAQATEAQFYATIEGQTWVLARSQEGVGIDAIIQPLVSKQTEDGAIQMGFDGVVLMETAINELNGKEGVRAYRIDGSYVFSDKSKLSIEGVSQKTKAALVSPVKLNPELGMVTSRYADKKLSGLDKDGNIVATYDFKSKEWQRTIPTYADWMLPHVEGMVGEQKDGVFYLVKEMADGRQIKAFEFVNEEWRPSYESMDLFVREDKTFDLEAAQQTMFMRMGPVDNVDGQSAMSVNMDDYQRFAQKCQSIWQGLTGLATSGFIGTNGGHPSDLSAGNQFSIRIASSGDQWPLIGFARNPIGSESVFVVATSDGPIALLNVGDLEYNLYDNDNYSIEEGVEKLSNGALEFDDIFILFLNAELNPNFRGKVNPVKLEMMRAYVLGMGINGSEIAAMMRGDIVAHRKALKFMFKRYPAPLEDFLRLS